MRTSDAAADRPIGTVLVVDDTEANRFAVSRMLEVAGFRVREAATGRDALARAAEPGSRPDLVLLDVRLPDLLGFEVARRLKADPDTAHIPVLHLSASFTSPEAAAEGLDAGAEGYLTHPVDPRVLVATVRAILRGAHAEARLRVSEARLQRLQSVATELAPVLDAVRAAQIIVAAGAELLGVRTASLGLLSADGATFELAAAVGMPDDVMAKWRRFPNAGDLPWPRAVASGGPLLIGTPEGYDAFPALGEEPERLGLGAEYVVPLVGGEGAVLGVVGFAFARGRVIGDDDRRLLEALARQGALAIERARLHEAERLARRAAEQASEAKSQFLANMSHELRTPLNAIQGYVELLEIGVHGPVNEAQLGALGRVQRAQRHLLSLINDILNLSKLEAGGVEFDVRPVALADVVADVLPMVEPQIAAKGLRCETDLALADDGGGAPIMVWADRAKLAQVLLNLLSNAVKFTASGGLVRVSVARRPASAALAQLVFLRVADTGIGVPREKQDAIFDPFVQVAAGLTRGSDGTGLGLAISRDLARGMGGDLRMRSAVGQGSTFTVALRRAQPGDAPRG
ncbi:ATP-binding protein [Roseisolibacter sp. H3M3-2]|uniref:ATP-binding protein n=1 Tax=Roseisolibacter sp. H3M3-2 TaxID=3031323 RepID=UPI0023DBB38D|nr:ATP-binding protein [Roseisolibacter sp. H3M3-2]MDF1505335.1 ATP-binding protein [Roseisolibacter sp. H3M3-2]